MQISEAQLTSLPRVSIVIPTYNHAHFLDKSLASVLAQTFTDWEAIVINNYSEDNTVEVVENFDDQRISLINFHNNGVIGASRNQGIELARGEWVAFLDSDDLWDKDKLSVCLAGADDDVDIISHPEIIVRNETELGATKVGSIRRGEYKNLLFNGNILSPSAILIRTSLLKSANGFSEDPELMTAEDYDLWLRLSRGGARFRFMARRLSQYTLHETNNINAFERHLAAGLTVLERHFSEMNRPSIIDKLRYRRARALAIYGAGRHCHNTENPVSALRYYWKAFVVFPFIAKLVAAVLLSINRTIFSRSSASKAG